MKIEERSFFLCSSLRDEYRYFDRRLKRERQLRKRNKSFEYGRIAIIIFTLSVKYFYQCKNLDISANALFLHVSSYFRYVAIL